MKPKAYFEQKLSKKEYLKQEIPEILAQKYFYNQGLLSPYNILRIKRYFTQTLMLCLFQTFTCLFLDPSQLTISINLSLGISFTMFFLLGNSAFLGLFLGCLTACFLKNYTILSTFLYLASNVGIGYLGAILCQKILSSEIRPFANGAETIKFIKINALLISPLASLFQMLGLMYPETGSWDSVISLGLKNLIQQYIQLWFFNLNGILVISSFLLSWTYIFHSREKISPIPIPAFILLIIALYLFVYSNSVIYLLLFSMAISFLWALFFGYLIATALIFIISIFYIIALSSQKQFLLEPFGMELNGILPLVLFIFIITMLWMGHVKVKIAKSVTY